MELTATGVVADETLTSDAAEIVGVTEFDARAASRASDDGITCRKRSTHHVHYNKHKSDLAKGGIAVASRLPNS